MLPVIGPLGTARAGACLLVGRPRDESDQGAGHRVVHDIVSSGSLDTSSILTPFAALLYEGIFINVLLGIFNLIPLPPLDGSHVLRHFLPDGVRRMFDMAGIAILWILVLLRVPFLGPLLGPAMDIFRNNLMRL